MPEVGCHGLRHSFASLCQILQMPPIAIMEIGGWKDRATMDKIYTHVSNSEMERAMSQNPLADLTPKKVGKDG